LNTRQRKGNVTDVSEEHHEHGPAEHQYTDNLIDHLKEEKREREERRKERRGSEVR
jgi:hypothetical protein